MVFCYLDRTYCKQVSAEEFQRQQQESTELALISLMNSIIDDTHLSIKEKRHRLKQCQRSHPEIYAKHFSHLT